MKGSFLQKAWRYLYLHCWQYYRIDDIHRRRLAALRQRSAGEPVRVVFFAMNVSLWRYQHLYELMRLDKRFAATIVLSPSIDYAREQQERDAQAMRDYFSAKQIPFVDCNLDSPVDVKRDIDPDVIFYPQPYEGLLCPQHDCVEFYDRLVAYYPYAFWTSTGKWSYNFHFHNLAWRLYYSTTMHLKEAQSIAWNKGSNVRVVGYPNADDFLRANFDEKVWKPINDGVDRKRIIWAPHYSITAEFGLAGRSQFLMMAEPMLTLARQMRDQVQIAFKPHPRLLTELYNHPDWGRERTDFYYRQWAEGENTQLEMGEFVDLFMTSDAMVHDSGSFVVEYHYSQRPVLFVCQDLDALLATQSDFGREAYRHSYIGAKWDDVIGFINRVVLGGNDPMRSGRERFYKDYLLPPHGKTVAQNTLDDIVESIFSDSDD